MSDLPPGWVEAPIGELGVEIRGSVRPEPGAKYELYSVPTFPTGVPEILRGSEIGSNKRPVEPGDVLLCKINPRINRVWIVGARLGIGQQLASTEYLVLRIGDDQLARYLIWYLRSPAFREWIKLSVEGATGSHTRAKSGPILRQLVPLPPPKERKRIVHALEQQFSRIDHAENSLRAVQTRIAAMRTSATALVLSGEWPTVPLRDVTVEQVYGSSAKATTKPSNGVPIIRMGNIQDGAIDFRDLKYLTADHEDVTRFKLRPGDLLFNRTNSPELVGKSAVYRAGAPEALFASYLIRVRLTPECDPRWAAAVINGPPGRQYIAMVRTQQVGQANVNGTKLAAMPMPLPPLREQQARLEEMERRESLIKALESAIEASLKRAESLRRAILDRAFGGTLVPQDQSDEPASVPLERIAWKRGSDQPKRARKAVSRRPRKG